MTLFMPTCAEVTSLLTDYDEGVLGPISWFRLRLHLSLCPPCQAFFDALKRTQEAIARGWDEPSPSVAEQALSRALAPLREGRSVSGPLHHPEPEAWTALEPGGDALLAILLRVHLGHCEACRQTRGASGEPIFLEPAMPEAAITRLLPSGQGLRWIHWGLGGLRLSPIGKDDSTGASLLLAKLPGGMRVPAHEHLGMERSLILSGRLQDGPAHLFPGDCVIHGVGDWHAPIADPGEDCWSLVHLTGPIRFHGWRGFLPVRSTSRNS